MRLIALLRNERGLTLVEMMLTMAIVALILLPVFTFMRQGTTTEATAGRQFNQQEKAFRILRELADGVDRGSTTMPGLRGATEVNVTGGLVYKAGTSIVTYYSAGESLYRKSCDSGSPGCVLTPIDPASGAEILTDVQDFSLDQDGRLVTVELEVRSPARTTGSSGTGLRLTTKVVVRNLP